MFFLLDLIDSVFRIYELIIIARILMSWINPDPYNPIVRFVRDLTEPVLAPARNLLPSMGGIDFSPIVVFIVLRVVRNVILGILRGLLF